MSFERNFEQIQYFGSYYDFNKKTDQHLLNYFDEDSFILPFYAIEYQLFCPV